MRIAPRHSVFRAVFAIALAASFPFFLSANPRKAKPRKKTTAEIVFEKHSDFLGGKNHPENLARQNEMADLHHLPRITDEDLPGKIESEFLVCVPKKSDYFTVNVPDERRYLSPEALRYMRKPTRAFSEHFSTPKKRRVLKISSLVRTEEYQDWLRGKTGRGKRKRPRNANAASGDTPETRSVHPTGYAFDISTKGMTQTEILWLADFLGNDASAGKILVIYEHKAQQDFHIFVIPSH